MSDNDRQKWNSKYSDPSFAPRQPSPVLVELAEHLPKHGKALDIAGGGGRHSIWLAQRGLDVTLADISQAGLKVARERATAAGVKFQALEHDLAEYGLPAGPWDLIVSICYLLKPTPALLAEHLAPGGVFVMIQPTTENLTRHEKPPRDFLLQGGELAKSFTSVHCEAAGLEVVLCTEQWAADDLHDAVLVVRRQ